jgi:hypothetical protein
MHRGGGVASRATPLNLVAAILAAFAFVFPSVNRSRAQDQSTVQAQAKKNKVSSFDDQISVNMQQMVEEGRPTFRFDTFGDEAFWGDMLKLHQAIEGTKFGASVRA